MARLWIRVDAEDGRTVSKFGAHKLDQIIFQNDAAQPLSIAVQGATERNGPICDNDGPVESFVVPAKRSEAFLVCGDWQEFKYTATVDGTVPEVAIVVVESRLPTTGEMKPIVIVEREFSGSEALWALAGLVIGLLVGVVLAHTLRPRATRD